MLKWPTEDSRAAVQKPSRMTPNFLIYKNLSTNLLFSRFWHNLGRSPQAKPFKFKDLGAVCEKNVVYARDSNEGFRRRRWQTREFRK